MKVLIYLASAICLYMLGLFIGYYTPALNVSRPEEQLYEQYTYYRMEEDGSFTGQTTAGVNVTGCIDNAQCNNE